MEDCPGLATDTLTRINKELHSRYTKTVVPVYARSPDKHVHDKDVAVHRLEAALAEVQTRLAMVKAKQNDDSRGKHLQHAIIVAMNMAGHKARLQCRPGP